MAKLLVALVLIAAAGLGAFIAFGSPSFTGRCPYGSERELDGKASCSPRPAPTAQERGAVRSGEALRAAVAAFKGSADAGEPLVGVGVNRWGDTTFALDTGERGLGRARQRYVTYDRGGGRGSRLDPERRGYALPVGTRRVRLATVSPGGLERIIARVRSRERGATLTEAVYGELGLAKGVGWRLIFTRVGPLFTDAKGGGLCAVGAARAGFPACRAGTGAAAAPPADEGGPKRVPGLKDPASIQDCLARAGTDVAALQRCASGG